MKFSARTIQILRNFSTINESLIFNKGTELKTIAQTKSILARAKIDTPIEARFGIYDLGEFLSAISLFDEPELIFGDNSITIKKGTEKIDYIYSEISLLQAPPEKEVMLPTREVEFVLNNEVLNRVQKALSIIKVPEIAITGDGEKIYVEALDSNDDSKSKYRVDVGTTTNRFKFIFKSENIKLLPGDYNVVISKKGLAHFECADVEYWIAVEQHSKYED